MITRNPAQAASGDYDLVVLDEATYIVKYGWMPVDALVTVIAERPARTNVVLTGRYAAPELIELADTVTTVLDAVRTGNFEDPAAGAAPHDPARRLHLRGIRIDHPRHPRRPGGARRR